MPKPDPALLAPERYPFACRFDPRFGDLDVNLHINNVAMAGMLEDGRVRFHRASQYREHLGDLRSMMASTAIEYIGEGAYPDPIDIHTAIEALGRTSHTLVQVVLQGARLLAFARTVLVTIGTDGPALLPEGFAASADPWKLRA